MNLVEKNQTLNEIDHATEQVEIKEISELTQALLKKRYTAVNKKILRGVHPKSHGCVRATFTIDPNISPELQQGLFAKLGKKYRALIRFSNATALVVDDMEDGKNLSRGMALKILNIRGGAAMLKNDNGARNQDFLMINTPSFAFANVPDYLRLTQVIHEDDDTADRFFLPLTPESSGFSAEQVATTKQSFKVIQQIGSKPVSDPLQIRYFGAAPFRFGDNNVMRFAVVPSDGEVPQQAPENPSANYLGETLAKRMNDNEAIAFDFMVQVRSNKDPDLELENATTHWDESEFKFIKVATIKIHAPQRNINSAKHERFCENLVFTPWHSLVAHEPLGGINRLRKDVYDTSSSSRLAKGRINQSPHNRARHSIKSKLIRAARGISGKKRFITRMR